MLLVVLNETIYFDTAVRQQIDQWPDSMVKVYTNYLTPSALESMVSLGSTTVLVLFSLIVLIALFWNGRYNLALLYGIMLGGGALVTVLMKMSIQRSRPSGIHYFNLFGLTGDVISYSFPSGHVVKNTLFFAFLISLIITTVNNRIIKFGTIALCTIIPVFIGLGQIITDRHYVSDVIGGYLVAFAWLGISLLLMRRVESGWAQAGLEHKVKKVK